MSDMPKLSKTEYAILDLLRNSGEMYGLQMVKTSEGALKRGSIYVYLTRMSEKGFVKSRAEKNPNDPGMPRRQYQISALGQQVLHAVDAGKAIMAAGLSRVGSAS